MRTGSDPNLPMKLTPDQVEAISRAVADPRRFAMLHDIASTPVLACSGLSAQECLSPATISHHLKELQTAGLVDVAREGRELRLTLRRDVWDAYLRELATL
jgi:ArsR family transcriptional regulator, arsenate/arsenite/antimonite-responsive transcriptional repressor